MVDDIRSTRNNPGLKPNGPQGAVPHVTVMMFTQLQENMKALETMLLQHEHSDIHPGPLLSTPCEHHFSVMRSVGWEHVERIALSRHTSISQQRNRIILSQNFNS